MAALMEDRAQPTAQTSSNILEMRGISKRFPGTVALDNVDLIVQRGELHALVGQNGAGKSTLVKILAGDYSATSGSIIIAGQVAEIRSTRDARDLGVGIVYQELSLLSNLSVADNIFLGREPMRSVILDQSAAILGAREALARMGIDHIDVRTRVGALALPERQMVEIAKVLSLRPRILVLDEPTAALTQSETDVLFSVLRTLKQQDVGIIYITHRFKEILSLCDRGTVLRSGRVVNVFETRETSLDQLVEATLGQQSDVVFRRTIKPPEIDRGGPVLDVRHLSIGDRVRDVSFAVSRGEIVGICGLLGAGQSDLGRALIGDREGVTGTIQLKGATVALRSPHQARRLGVGFLSDSRREEGLFPDLTTGENVSIASLSRFILSRIVPIIRKRPLRRGITRVAAQTNIAPAALARPVRLLSGGNQQKALLSRWLMRDADVLVFLEPTLGVDVGAKVEVYRQLEALAQAGKGIIIVSTDIPEILGLSDRIVVMHRGTIASVFDATDATEERIILTMQGAPNDGGTDATS